MYIINYLKSNSIFLGIKQKKKKEAIFAMLDGAAQRGIIPEDKVKELFSSVMEREQQSSTGIGNGIAIPHCRSESIKSGIILAATVPNGIKYNSLDNKPVHIIFLFIFPPSENKEYLQILAKTARLLGEEDIRNKLILASKDEDFRAIIQKSDIIPIQNGSKGKYIFMLVLNDQKKLQTVISNLVEIGASTSVILDSETVEKKLAYDIPIFAGLTYFKGKSPYSKTFIGTLDDSSQINYLNKLLQKEGINLGKPGAGFLISIKADQIIGGIPEEVEI